ncbi:MAG: hypothetical protein V4450_17800 [Bacteroidota bacterium]
MSLKKICRFCRCVILFVLLLPAISHGQVSDGNYIVITLGEESYNCATGQLSVRFHITNYDMFDNTGNFPTIYNIDLGASRVVGRSLPGGNGDVWFEGNYHPGDEVVCTAWGTGNNAAPESAYRFVASVSPPPAVPLVSSSAAMPLCNGAATILTAQGSSGNYVWSNGATGASIPVSAAGMYTAHAVGDCGVSAESSPITVTTLVIPAAPVIGSGNGTLLCNGNTTTFLATSSGGTVNWSNGATGTSMVTASPGAYYASETNGCGTSGNSNIITISTGITPNAPSVASSNGTSLCNGETTVLSAAPTAGGSITWSTGATGGSISLSNPGSYYAYESNSCGTSANSNVVTITTGSVPSAPSITSSNGTMLCNGAGTVLSASGSGTISWNTGSVSGSMGVTSAGTYYAVASNNCGTSGASNSIVISTGGTPGAPSVSSSNGTLLCNGASSTLSTSPSYGGTIRWSTGASGNSLSVNGAANYYAYETNGCGNSSNSNTISITTATTPAVPTVTPSGNQLLCNGASVTLSSSGANVLWSNGATGNTITTSTAGSYYAIDRNVCGNSSASNPVNVTTVVCPTPVPGGSFLVCPGTLKTLDAGAGYDTYDWSNGATTRTIAVGPGTYTVTVSKSGCYVSSAAVTVGYYTVATPTITASGATTFCAGGSVTLNASAGNAYSWNMGSTNSSINVTNSDAYYVSVTDGNGCQATSAAVNVVVNPLPSASIAGTTSVCQNAVSPGVAFTGAGGTAPYTFTYKVNGGAAQSVTTAGGNSVSVSAPTGSAGIYTYSLISVQESSSTACTNAASGSATVTVNALPTAGISGNATVCKNSAAPLVIFTANGGSGPYTFTYRINGGTNQVISTTSGSSVSIAVPTSLAGTFVYSLVSVQESGSCVSSVSGTATITVNPLPDASISGTATVCQSSASPVITFAGGGGIAPYTFIYKINNGTSQTITTVSGNSVTLPVPTSSAEDFVYTLIGVQESSGTTCTNAASGSVTVSVHALPTATISGSTTLCRNATSPSITFTGNGGAAPYTFSYRINGGSLQTVTTMSGNSTSVQVPTATAGSFVYSLVSVQEASSTACASVVAANATVVINPLPTASISGNTILCQNSRSPVVSFTGNGGVAPYTFSYRIGTGPVQTVTTVSGNAVDVNVPTITAGSFTYTLVSVQDASATACSNAATGNVTIVVNPQPVKAIVSTNNSHLCNGETGVLKITNYVSGYSYTWYKEGTLIRTTTKDTLQVDQPGNYTVLGISPESCSAAAISDVVIITTGTVVTPIITGSLKVCPGGKTMLIASSGKEGLLYNTWRWTDPPRNRLLSEDSSFFVEAGQYRVWVSAQGCADSANVAVTADDTEFPAGQLMIYPGSIAYGERVTLTANVKGAASYTWDLGDRKKINTIGNEIEQHFYRGGDSIPVKVWATSVRNCVSLFSSYVRVAPMKQDSLPDHSFTGTVRDWNVFPIPFTNQLKVTAILKRNENVRLDLFSSDGRWLRKWMFNGYKGENQFVLDGLGTLLSGSIYFLAGFYNNEKHLEKVFKK